MSQTLITEEDVIRELKKILVETLRLDPDAISADSSLINDLGAESLDLLDVVYQLEQVFGIKMARHHVLEHAEDIYGEGTAIDEESGELTAAAVALLRARFGEDCPGIEEGMDMDEVPMLVTVRSMAQAVLDILATLPERCSQCAASAWRLEGTKIVCGACNAAATYTNGDDLVEAWIKAVQDEKGIF